MRHNIRIAPVVPLFRSCGAIAKATWACMQSRANCEPTFFFSEWGMAHAVHIVHVRYDSCNDGEKTNEIATLFLSYKFA